MFQNTEEDDLKHLEEDDVPKEQETKGMDNKVELRRCTNLGWTSDTNTQKSTT